MRGFSLAALAVAGLAGSAFASGPEAISCRGIAETSDTTSGRLIHYKLNAPEQIYVFNAGSRSVQRALSPRRMFEDVCWSDQGVRNVSFAGRQVTVTQLDQNNICTFSYDRRAGKAEWKLDMRFSNGRFHKIDVITQCVSSAVPVYGASEANH